MKHVVAGATALLTLGLFVAAAAGAIPDRAIEALGFITGAACVFLVVRQHIWNFPLGIASCAFFLILFFNARLYGDAGLQVVYIALGFQGWYWWLRGGPQGTERAVERAPLPVLLALAGLVAAGTWGLTVGLRAVRGAAPG